jgi:tetratricopeptide (TPR) repeat protein
MKLLQTRRNIVIAIALLVLLIAAIYGIIQMSSPYYGLNLETSVEMTDEERFFVTQRIEVTESALQAQRAVEDVDLDLLLGLAFDYSLIGDLVGSREVYEEYFEYNNINYSVWANYAGVLKKMQDIDGAEKAYLTALELRPSEAYYRNYISFLQNYFDEGERDADIIAALEAGVISQGQTPWFMVALANYYLDHDECQKAFDHFDVLLTLLPDNTGVVDDYERAKETCGQEE